MTLTAYYNEIEPLAADWLRNLISVGLIAPGEVDTRSIKDVSADDVRGFTQCHFFAGIGGWSAALRIAGWPDDCPAWTGSCPCQPFSAAGKRKGESDERHLWPDFRRLIAECSPSVVFGEQVASKDGRNWLSRVRSELEEMGYGVGAADLCAAGKGAPHIRQRLWWVADAGCCEACRSRCGRSDEKNSKEEGYRQRESKSERCGQVGGMDDTERHGRRSRRDNDGEHDGQQFNSTRIVGDASQPRLSLSERQELPGAEQLDQGRATQQSGRSSWSDFSIIPCLDGKSRRVESGSFPLVDGIPRDMGSGRSKLERVAIRAARSNRTGRLKGYGNAIVPAVAAEFIAAFIESTT